MSRPILLLDFDGVVVDSIRECYEVSLRAFCEGSLGDRYSQFAKYRYLVGPPEQYKILIDLILRGSNEIIRNFNAIKENPEFDSSMVAESFFQTRKSMMNEDMGAWLSLHKPQEDFLNIYHKLESLFEIRLLTTKDLNSVKALLGWLGINISHDKLYTNKDFHKKSEIASEVCHENLDLKVLFLDDNVFHIEDVAQKSKTQCFLAGWGYISPDARASDFYVESPGDFFERAKKL